jgi:hypothetical protein
MGEKKDSFLCCSNLNRFMWKDYQVGSNMHMMPGPFVHRNFLIIFRILASLSYLAYSLWLVLENGFGKLKFLTIWGVICTAITFSMLSISLLI